MLNEWNIVSSKKNKKIHMKQQNIVKFNKELEKMRHDDLVRNFTENGKAGNIYYFKKMYPKYIANLKKSDITKILNDLNFRIAEESLWSCEEQNYFGIEPSEHVQTMADIKSCIEHISAIANANNNFD